MTKNQIEYWSLQEQKRANTETARHNVAQEGETNRHNVATEGIDMSKLSETSRHNKATEGIDMGKLNESIRHNQVTEGIDLGKLNESIRHNTSSEKIESGKLNESIRHNQATESAAQQTIQLEYSKLQEAMRNNRAIEFIKQDKNNIREVLGLLQHQLGEAQLNVMKDDNDRARLIREIEVAGDLAIRQQDVNNKTVDTISKVLSRGLDILKGATPQPRTIGF